MRFRTETRTAIVAVRHGLHLAQQRTGDNAVTCKDGARDVATAVDVAIEDDLRKQLVAAFGWPVVGEERGGERPSKDSPYWLLDPICGTRNFASGVPLWCVNVALVEGGVVTTTAVADASTGEIYVAERGNGAWGIDAADGLRRLAVSTSPAIVVLDPGKSSGDRRDRAARTTAAAISADRWEVCALSTTLALAYAAAGRTAAYVVFFASAVHTAAGVLLITEADGVVSDIDGEPWNVDSDSALAAATPSLHAELVALARDPSVS